MKRGADRLETYRQKRNFEVTSEPAPSQARPTVTGLPRFMVHKHDATRLHYDIRLEHEGVLASWACPKGPSYDPDQKRLAVQTEDHPLEYGDFEGRIPDGEYGAGDSLVWDRGTYDTVPPGQFQAQVDKGHLRLVFRGEKLKGEWHLIRTRPQGDKPQWLFFKAKDGTERPDYDVIAERPESVVSGRRITRGPVRGSTLRKVRLAPGALLDRVWPPMLATLVDGPPADDARFVYEVKYDGYRAVVGVSGGRIAARSRNGLDLLPRFPFLADALRPLVVGEAVLDGELVGLDRSGASRFELLGDVNADQQLVVFDLLWLDGEDLRGRPLEERRELLESVMASVPPPLTLARRVDGGAAEALALARKSGWEGVIAKVKGSTYTGKRGMDWLKLKVARTAELAIIGWTPHTASRTAVGALLLGARRDGRLTYAGKVGTGFDARTRVQLRSLLEKDQVESSEVEDAPRLKKALWVRPRHVAQVRFTEWTADGKLRHPAFQGLREDKDPGEVSVEQPVELDRAAPSPEAAAPAAPEPAPRNFFGGSAGTAFGVWHSKGVMAASSAPVGPVPITHPERVLFPASRVTKAEVRAYYDMVAPWLVPALAGRALTMQQFPRGITGEGFFRHAAASAPSWISRAYIHHDDRDVEHIVVDRPQTLSWLANQSALTLHAMSSRVETLDQPDWVAFDFDPPDGARDWKDLVPLALALKGLLEQLGLRSVPKTSGKRGLHVFVPLAPGHTHEAAQDFARDVVHVLAAAFPDRATDLRPKKLRHGRLYLDPEQNGKLKTMVAPYSIRAVEGAPVSTPLHWDEVSTRLDPSAFTVRTMEKRLAREGDLFAPALSGAGQRLPGRSEKAAATPA